MKGKCHECGVRTDVTRFRKKNWCRACLCREDTGTIVLCRSPMGVDLPPGNQFGFNTAKFSRQVTRSMRRLGMKYTSWKRGEKQ